MVFTITAILSQVSWYFPNSPTNDISLEHFNTVANIDNNLSQNSKYNIAINKTNKAIENKNSGLDWNSLIPLG